MNYSQLFQDHYGQLPPVIRAVCQGLDEQEQWFERMRVHCGFHQDWSPYHDRTKSLSPLSVKTWMEKYAAINGMGDMQRLVGEICQWMDVAEIKKAEVADALAAKVEPEKRGPGRPRNVA